MWLVGVAICLAACLSPARAAWGGQGGSSPAPLSIPPSLFFDGNDGKWSTFHVRVGTPEQTLRLLPGTSASAGDTIWAVLDEGCSLANPNLTSCTDDRATFSRNESTTWSIERLENNGLYQLNTFEEHKLGLTGNAYYGFDTVTLGLEGSGLPTFTDQLVAGFATNNWWLGSLPLSPIPFNITDLNNPIPSLLGRLRNDSTVPSSSWGYTAGAAYHDPPVYGSLTFGGYDTSRFSNITILHDVAFGADFSRDLIVQLQSITYDSIGSSPLLTEDIYIFIDSMVSHLWLPISVCQSFERAFNLTWNATQELYLIDDAVHTSLLAQNPTFTFNLASTGNSSSIVSIALPYAAFDLSVSPPYVNSTTRYFPLKQAANSTQYTLGRVFLQEAYVIADYERSTFSVAQALFPDTSVPQNLVPINPPSKSIETTPVPTPKPSGISGGVIAGIVVGAVVVIALIAGMFILLRRRRAKRALDRDSGLGLTDFSADEKRAPDSQAGPPVELDRNGERFEADGEAQKVRPEMDGGGAVPKTELDGQSFVRTELDAGDKNKYKHGVQSSRYELSGGDVEAVELEAPLR